MISYNNHIYGIIIGGTIADAMGAVSEYAPGLKIIDPYSCEAVGIKPGYWTEPTGLFLSRLEHINSSQPWVCTGMYSSNNINEFPILSKVIQASALCILIPEHENQIIAARQHLCTEQRISNDTILLWLAIMDGAIHNISKKNLLKPMFYKHLDLVPEVHYVLKSGAAPYDMLPELEIIKEVLELFNKTNNFLEGLHMAINESMYPVWTGSLYGQLAGAYYGLTDIPENWMDTVQDSQRILELVRSKTRLVSPTKSVSNVML